MLRSSCSHLVAQESSDNFFVFQRSNDSKLNFQSLGKINEIWRKIEILLQVIELLTEPIRNHESLSNAQIDQLCIVLELFYVYYSTITTIIKQAYDKESLIQVLGDQKQRYEELKNKINKIRNRVFVHYDKPNFYEKISTSWGADNGGLDLIITVDDDGKEKIFKCNPLVDGLELKNYLIKLV